VESENVSERILYGFWLSPYMSQVAHVLTEAELPFRYERVSPYQGSTFAPEHLSRNPLAKIPSLRDVNGVDLAESQAICRYLARMYPAARKFYPVDDPVLCAEVDAKNDYIAFSIGGPFFNWFVFCAYFPKAWNLNLEGEAEVYGRCSLFFVAGGLMRLIQSARMAPYLMGEEPYLPDFQLFHMLEVSRTFAKLFDMPEIDLVQGNAALQAFHAAMCERPSTREILAAQAAELETSRQELFNEFGDAYGRILDRRLIEGLFGHPV
jgi:glutathione S-transferase